ncbi:10 kDa chaperonin 1, chloroplastic [Vitis vinifera]|uniref:10 kDa chaperonin 1, chloroplastic n=1 Tax=Vitis vinifera TaxID=29760 RepID=A0A438G6J8_VITVI|nr:10 kDa chaperonin 1, chloroplastic [Vitis vinifera]
MASTFITLARPFSSHKPHTPSPSKRLLGLRSSALKINAIAKKWEPTKVVPQADRVLIRLQDLPEVKKRPAHEMGFKCYWFDVRY